MVVANAVDPIPIVVPEPIGGRIEILGADKYPDPTFVTSIEIVPAAETIAVADAPTFITPEVKSASTWFIVRSYLSADKGSTCLCASIWLPFS